MRKETILSLLNLNKKRLLGVGMAALVFLVSSSFWPSFFPGREYGREVQAQQLQKQQVEMEAQQLQGQQMEIEIEEQQMPLADTPLEPVQDEVEDILFAEEMEQEHGGSDTQYSVDEILGDSHSQQLLKQKVEIDETNGFSKDDWNLILVNKQHPVPEDYTFELGVIAADMQCDARILPELFSMLQAARDDGVNLIICSPYRDISLQRVLFDRKIALYMGQGDNYMEAYKKASQIVTVPGASEHQIGLALDIICDTYTNLDEGFGETKAGKWLQEHSKEYGFILRYPLGKENITGIGYEPWHFRYVGKEAAGIIMDNGITLEEFVESISE